MENPFTPINERLETIELLLQDLKIALSSEDKPRAGHLISTNVVRDDELSIKELAAYLKCSVQTIHKKKRDGSLPYYRSGRIVYFKKSEIDQIAQVVKINPKTKVHLINKFTYSNN